MPTAVLSVSCAGLTLREKAFVMFAWLPKATVQAALASAPLDRILVRPKAALNTSHDLKTHGSSQECSASLLRCPMRSSRQAENKRNLRATAKIMSSIDINIINVFF